MRSPPWDAALLGRIGQLHLRARRAVAGWHQGQHLSHKASSNIEFVDYKDYAPGDPVSSVDWRVAARTDRLVIRRHVAETEVAVTLVVDASGDLGTGQPDLDASKLGATIVLAASLALLIDRAGDRVGLEVLGGTGHSQSSWPPRRSALPTIIKTLAVLGADGTADLGTALSEIGRRMPRRSIVIVLSDLMEDPATWGPGIRTMSQRGVDVRVLHIHDPAEWGLEIDREIKVFSPEGGPELPIDPAAAREQMPGVVEAYLSEVRTILAGARAHHHLVASNAPLDTAIHAALGGRR